MEKIDHKLRDEIIEQLLWNQSTILCTLQEIADKIDAEVSEIEIADRLSATQVLIDELLERQVAIDEQTEK